MEQGSTLCHLIKNQNMFIENVKYNVSESITGLITNRKQKEKFPNCLKPFIYECIGEDERCIKLVIKNVKVNNNCIDNLYALYKESKNF